MKMCRWVSPAKRNRFFFKTHVYDLIESMQSFKASMTFKNLDFNADKATQYSVLQETMAAIYWDDETLFGPTEALNWPENFGQLSQKDQVTSEKRDQNTKRLAVVLGSRINIAIS